MNVFVTGGTGFVGAHLVRALQERGDRVTCLARRPELAERLGWRDVRVVRGDLDDTAALLDGCQGAELVFHVAGKNRFSGDYDGRDAVMDLFDRRNREAGGKVGGVGGDHELAQI